MDLLIKHIKNALKEREYSVKEEIGCTDKEYEDMSNEVISTLATFRDKGTKYEKYTFIPLENLNLSIRPYNALRRRGVDTVRDLLVLWFIEPDGLEVFRIRNMGALSFAEVKQALEPYLKEINND